MEKNKRENLFGILLGWVMIFVFLVLNNETDFYYDSLGYWQLSTNFYGGGKFFFNPGDFNLRGYIYPLFLALINGAGGYSKYIYWLLLSLIYSILIVYFMGKLFELIFHKELSVIKRLVPVFMLMFFWPGLLLYPLSDLMAVLISMLAVYFICLSVQSTVISKEIVCAFGAGAMSYIALNIRATYKWNIYLGVILLIVWCWKKNWKKAIRTVILFGLGVVLFAIPQIYANYYNYGVLTYDNPLSMYTNNRMAYLLFEGADWVRYETYVGTDSSISPSVIGIDPIMQIVFNRENIELSVQNSYSIIEYIKLFLKYPIEVLEMYFSHLVNCLDVRYGEIYIKEFGNRYFKQMISILVYLFLLIDIHNKILVKKVNGLSTKSIYGMICKRYAIFIFFILLPALISLPGHIEPRYAISLHILIYAYLAYLMDYNAILKWIKEHIGVFILFYSVFFMGITLIQNWSLAMAGYSNLLF